MCTRAVDSFVKLLRFCVLVGLFVVTLLPPNLSADELPKLFSVQQLKLLESGYKITKDELPQGEKICLIGSKRRTKSECLCCQTQGLPIAELWSEQGTCKAYSLENIEARTDLMVTTKVVAVSTNILLSEF